MAKRSGSRSSRSERKAGKERILRARERGLPEASPPAAPRASRSRESDASTEGSGAQTSEVPAAVAEARGLPTGAKLAIAAAVLLGGVYLLSRYRDSTSSIAPETAGSVSPVVVTEPALATSSGASPPAEPGTLPTTVPEPFGAVSSDSLPAVPSVTEPSVSKPVAPKPIAAEPKPAALVSVPARPAEPKPAAVPAVPGPLPPRPVDNPY